MDNTSQKLKVFVVDDEPGICLGVGAILRDFKVNDQTSNSQVEFEIFTFNDGESMIESLEKEVPHLLLLDCKLPGIDGMEILENYLNPENEILTIMITAYATIETAIKATKLGAYDFLAKPFTPDELRYTVRKAVTHIMLRGQAKRLEEEKKRIRFEFIRVLAHELKSPINAVDGYLDLIKNRILGDEIEAYDGLVEKSVIRIDGMRKMIGDLLDLTRIESGQKKRMIENIDIIEIAKNSIELNCLSAEKSNINIELFSPDSLFMSADSGEIQIIFNNLISNAVKYNIKNGNVFIRISEDNNLVNIEVEDTGIGLTSDELSKLFNEFSRIKNEKTRNIQGSGLGLSIVKKISGLYGGDVDCSSTSGKGSIFYVTLNKTTVEGQL
ncbi:MAG: response regulator [Deltaproteobacteria bacterium]|nr:response regulator [Deltaproteobacteria bacterium]